MNLHSIASWTFVVSVGLAAISCSGDLNPQEQAQLAAMQLAAEAGLPPSPTNRVADLPAARTLGQRLFFDKRMSSDGTIACASCHKASEGFSDARALSLGVGGQAGGRHAMPVTAVAFHPFLLSDGKADSVWLQPLKAIENKKEMNLTRVEVARFIASTHRAEYEAVFGVLPDVEALPKTGAPGTAEWDAMTAQQQDPVQRVFTNVGKAIEAYERQLTCADTRFDRFARGEVQLTAAERRGAATFTGEGGCIRCHSGVSFSDGEFHNLGIVSGNTAPDSGRLAGAKALLADPLNGAGVYSDDVAEGKKKLATIALERSQEGAFRTLSLRGVGQRQFFGHRGHQQRLEDFIRDVYDRRGGRNGRGRSGGQIAGNVGVLDPKLQDVDVGNGVDDLVAFLRTLDCPPVDGGLLRP